MADFLSDQWVEELKNLGSKLPKVQGHQSHASMKFQELQRENTVLHSLERGSVSEASKEKLDNPECRFTAKYDDIREIFLEGLAPKRHLCEVTLRSKEIIKSF